MEKGVAGAGWQPVRRQARGQPLAERKGWIRAGRPLPLARQCGLAGVARSTVYAPRRAALGAGGAGRVVRGEPVFQGRVDARLPAAPGAPEGVQHLGVKADRGEHLRVCRSRTATAQRGLDRLPFLVRQRHGVRVGQRCRRDGRVFFGGRENDGAPGARLNCLRHIALPLWHWLCAS